MGPEIYYFFYYGLVFELAEFLEFDRALFLELILELPPTGGSIFFETEPGPRLISLDLGLGMFAGFPVIIFCSFGFDFTGDGGFSSFA